MVEIKACPACNQRLVVLADGAADDLVRCGCTVVSLEWLNIARVLSPSPDRLREALWLFREFVLRNATQWELGAGHHHPIWAMIAELIGEQGGIVSGPLWQFIQADNRAALATPNAQEGEGA